MVYSPVCSHFARVYGKSATPSATQTISLSLTPLIYAPSSSKSRIDFLLGFFIQTASSFSLSYQAAQTSTFDISEFNRM